MTDPQPIQDFSRCHEGILSRLAPLSELPALLEGARRARTLAEGLLAFFEQVVLAHHADEERDLFPAVLRHAAPGDERTEVAGLVARLEGEHRAIERRWHDLEPALRAAARGLLSAPDPEAVDRLLRDYRAHAEFEEATFLPLAAAILGRQGDHLAALALSLHTRHEAQALAQQIGFHV